MINARTHNTVSVSAAALFAAVARYLAAAALTVGQHVLAAMRESREREAARVIARYRHLSEDAKRFHQREIERQKLPQRPQTKAGSPRRVPRPFHIDPMQGTQ